MVGAEPSRAPARARVEEFARDSAPGSTHAAVQGAVHGRAPESGRADRAAARHARLLHSATYGLVLRAPHLSAARRLTPPQIRGFTALAAFALASSLLAPALALALVSALGIAGFGSLILFRLFASAAPPAPTEPGAPPVALPRYTILCPMYREARMIPGLVAALDALDYPKALLDIKLVVEADDAPTLAAARRHAASHMQVVATPPGQPRTKPKAMNYALAFARGSLLAIYDAEDRPDPRQLRAAVAAFARGGEELVCVQAPLAFYNSAENFLTRSFALEYAIHFRVILPALLRLGAPIPLGGTSNHFRTEALRRAGAWDPFNVTEDADLGFRLAALGGRIGMIAPPTLEEATCTTADWVRQRSRWLKGYAQTLLVHTRGPLREFDPRKAAALWLTLGGALAAALLHGPALIWLAWAASQDGAPKLAVAMLLGGYGSTLIAGCAAAIRMRDISILPALALTPFYWPLQTFAAARALRQLVCDPFRWEKTEHGVSRMAPPSQSAPDVRAKERRRRFPAGAVLVPNDGT